MPSSRHIDGTMTAPDPDSRPTAGRLGRLRDGLGDNRSDRDTAAPFHGRSTFHFVRRFAELGGVVALVLFLSSCAGQAEPKSGAPSTTPLPFQESGLVLEEGVEQHATKRAEYALSDQEMKDIAKACADAQGIPLGGSDPCTKVMENRSPQPCGRLTPCLEVYEVNTAGFAAAGYAQITDPRPRHSLCAAGNALCLRVGVKARMLDRLAKISDAPTPSPDPTPAPSQSPSLDPSPSTTSSPNTDVTVKPVPTPASTASATP